MDEPTTPANTSESTPAPVSPQPAPETSTPPATVTESPPETPETEGPSQPDVEALARAVEEKVKSSLLARLGSEANQPTPPTAQPPVPPWEKRGEAAPANWQEVTDHSVEVAMWRLQQEKNRQEAESRQQLQEAEKWNRYWDDQLADLVKTKKIPAIKDKDNPADAGVVARRALFQAMAEVNQKRLAAGLPVIFSLKEIFYEHYQPRQVPGAEAPVSLGAQPGLQKPEISYNEIANTTFEKILAGGKT